MNVENMRLWIEALRSRRYKQIFYRLYGWGNESCALGVAGRVLLGANYNNSVDTLEIAKALGNEDSLYYSVINLNDNKKKKFYEIARFLERRVNAYEKGKV